jgi:hypothetical protein
MAKREVVHLCIFFALPLAKLCSMNHWALLDRNCLQADGSSWSTSLKVGVTYIVVW